MSGLSETLGQIRYWNVIRDKVVYVSVIKVGVGNEDAIIIKTVRNNL